MGRGGGGGARRRRGEAVTGHGDDDGGLGGGTCIRRATKISTGAARALIGMCIMPVASETQTYVFSYGFLCHAPAAPLPLLSL